MVELLRLAVVVRRHALDVLQRRRAEELHAEDCVERVEQQEQHGDVDARRDGEQQRLEERTNA